jgi:hypothetical protein
MNYRKYSDKDLLESYSTALDYSGKANDELLLEIDSRGGIDQLKRNVSEQNVVPNEMKRINHLVFVLYKNGGDPGKIKSAVTSEILNAAQLNNAIDNAIVAAGKYVKNRSISARTIIGSLIGMTIGGLIGAALICYAIINSRKFYFITMAVTCIISYGLIWLLTRQNRSNIVVFIAVLASAFIAVPLRIWFYSLLINTN